MILTRPLLFLGLWIGCATPRAPEMTPAESLDSLPASDTAAVLALAAEFGIPRPDSIGRPFEQVVGCPVLIVVSPITVDGNRRSWVELTVRRRGRDTGGHRCQAPDPSDGKVERRDRWVTSSAERSERSLWRVSDGDWHVDVRLGPNVSYDTATIIVRAVRRRTLMNQIPAMLRRMMGDTLPAVDASDISEIDKSSSETGVYIVKVGRWRGSVLYVSVVAGQALVQSIGSWQSG